MATLTSSAYAAPAKELHAGLQARSVAYKYGAASAAGGDIILLFKIPVGARIVEVIQEHTAAFDSCTVDVGMRTGAPGGGGADMSAFVAAGAKGQINRLGKVNAIPYRVSLSASDYARYADMVAKINCASATLSAEVRVTVMYQMDE